MNRLFKVGFILLFPMIFSEFASAQHVRVRRNHRSTVVVARRPVHKVVLRRTPVRYVGMPRWGTTVSVLPVTHVTVNFRNNNYFYDRGVYYTKRNNSYAVVRPVRGVRVNILPVGYRQVILGPRNYYYYYGTFYTKAANEENYVVINPPSGAVVDALPEGYEVKVVDGNEYYYLDGVYYAEVDAPEFDDKIGFQVVEF